MRSFTFILFSVAFSLASASPLLQEASKDEFDSLMHELGLRGICAGVDMRGGAGSPQAPDYYGNVCRNQRTYTSAYTFDSRLAQTTINTHVAADGRVHASGIGVPKGAHNWELSLLQAIIDNGPNSVCAQLRRFPRQQVPQYIQGIKALINSVDNLVYFEFNIEKLKGETMRQFLRAGGVRAPAHVMEINRAATDLEWMALNDYLHQTAHRTQHVAQQIDNIILHNFRGAPAGLAQAWANYMSQVANVAHHAATSATNTWQHLYSQYCAQQQQHQYPGYPQGGHSGYPHYPRGLVARMVDLTDTLLRRAGVKTAPKPTTPGKGSKDQPAVSCPMPPKSTNGTTPATGKTPTKPGTKTPTKPGTKTPTPGKKPVIVKKPTPRKPTKPKPIVRKPTRPVRPPVKSSPRRPTRPPPKKVGRPRSLE
ncbi:hypothetical protein EXIGLDRAFT_699649 [Exidia glandulosa HHB12029]|uniref:Uncharacterized protein n=1 Tax=Exidia glandulosa HHB12029 TaxID=1314781 RepID=A0A165DTU1_EXIGL|nr:hypothetical protein EXIGLDRAFT_699649 [Exidia glandulosa HHB12029]